MADVVRYQVMPPLSADEYQDLFEDIKRVENLNGFKPLDRSEIDWFITQAPDLAIAKIQILNAMWREAHPGWRRKTRIGSVYFIEAPSAGVVKIGFSEHPRRRMESIASMSPLPLRMVATMPGTMADEQALHRRFEHIRSHGEWFYFTSEIEEFIGGIK